MIPRILLRFGGVGTFTAAFMITVVFLLLFIMSFAFGKTPAPGRRFSREWLSAWGKASFPRLVITGIFCAGLFVASSFSGSSQGSGAQNASDFVNACDRPVGALTKNPLTAARVESAITGMHRLREAAASKDTNLAQAVFFSGDTHNVTHDIDLPLRSADPDLAKKLCYSVLVLEVQLPGRPDWTVVAREADNSAALLQAAEQKLGLS